MLSLKCSIDEFDCNYFVNAEDKQEIMNNITDNAFKVHSISDNCIATQLVQKIFIKAAEVCCQYF